MLAMKTASPSRGSRLGLRVLITLALVAFVVIILIFYLSQPVAAPGDEESIPRSRLMLLRLVFPCHPRSCLCPIAMAIGIFTPPPPPTEAVNLSANDANDGFPCIHSIRCRLVMFPAAPKRVKSAAI